MLMQIRAVIVAIINTNNAMTFQKSSSGMSLKLILAGGRSLIETELPEKKPKMMIIKTIQKPTKYNICHAIFKN